MEEIEKKVNLVTDFLFTLVKYFQAINLKETHGTKISMSQYFVMDFLLQNKESTMGGLSKFLKVKLSTTSEMIDKLEKLGLIKRERDKEDRRIVSIRLRDKGVRIAREIGKRRYEEHLWILKQLDEKEMEALLNIIAKISQIFQGKKR